jgi:hypothetical protein
MAKKKDRVSLKFASRTGQRRVIEIVLVLILSSEGCNVNLSAARGCERVVGSGIDGRHP